MFDKTEEGVYSLKSCPLCGSNDARLERRKNGWGVRCNCCLCQVRVKLSKPENAVSAWNRRSTKERVKTIVIENNKIRPLLS